MMKGGRHWFGAPFCKSQSTKHLRPDGDGRQKPGPALSDALNNWGPLTADPKERLGSKDHAAPKPRMPAETPAANHRCHDDGRYHGRCYDSRRRNYDWPVRAASSVRTAVKSGTATTGSTGAVDADECE